MDIVIDHGKCIGAGQCALIAPEVFDQRADDGLAVLVEEHPGSEHLEAVREAGESCPLGAITLTDDPRSAA
ncbi:ferredoxin [Streptomyces sparsus]